MVSGVCFLRESTCEAEAAARKAICRVVAPAGPGRPPRPCADTPATACGASTSLARPVISWSAEVRDHAARGLIDFGHRLGQDALGVNADDDGFSDELSRLSVEPRDLHASVGGDGRTRAGRTTPITTNNAFGFRRADADDTSENRPISRSGRTASRSVATGQVAEEPRSQLAGGAARPVVCFPGADDGRRFVCVSALPAITTEWATSKRTSRRARAAFG